MTIGAKENVAPPNEHKELSSTDSLLLLPKAKKPAVKRYRVNGRDWQLGFTATVVFNSMGYLEMKRVNQDLLTEIQSLRSKTESSEMKHIDAINKLAQEIAEHKVGGFCDGCHVKQMDCSCRRFMQN